MEIDKKILQEYNELVEKLEKSHDVCRGLYNQAKIEGNNGFQNEETQDAFLNYLITSIKKVLTFYSQVVTAKHLINLLGLDTDKKTLPKETLNKLLTYSTDLISNHFLKRFESWFGEHAVTFLEETDPTARNFIEKLREVGLDSESMSKQLYNKSEKFRRLTGKLTKDFLFEEDPFNISEFEKFMSDVRSNGIISIEYPKFSEAVETNYGDYSKVSQEKLPTLPEILEGCILKTKLTHLRKVYYMDKK